MPRAMAFAGVRGITDPSGRDSFMDEDKTGATAASKKPSWVPAEQGDLNVELYKPYTEAQQHSMGMQEVWEQTGDAGSIVWERRQVDRPGMQEVWEQRQTDKKRKQAEREGLQTQKREEYAARKAQQHVEWERRQAAGRPAYAVREAQQHAERERRQVDRPGKQEVWQQRQADKKRRQAEREGLQTQKRGKYAANAAAKKKKCEQISTVRQRHDAEKKALRDQYEACWVRLCASYGEVSAGAAHREKMELPTARQRRQRWNSHREALHAQKKALHAQKNDLRAQKEALEHAHREEMFNYVQDNEHEGRVRDGSWVDLHGCKVDYVTDYLFPQFLLDAVDKHRDVVEVITGAGKHSVGGRSIIKSWVWTSEDSLLNRAKRGEVPGLEGLDFDESDENAGSVKVILSAVKPAVPTE